MKYHHLLPTVLFGIIGCAHSHVQAPNPTEKATVADCKNVYKSILTMVITDQVNTEGTMSPKEEEGAEWELDQAWEESGTKEKFFRYCQASMTPNQIECALHMNHVDELRPCVTLVK